VTQRLDISIEHAAFIILEELLELQLGSARLVTEPI
jgi:hypothetical protein